MKIMKASDFWLPRLFFSLYLNPLHIVLAVQFLARIDQSSQLGLQFG